MERPTYTAPILQLNSNEIFVFGSNTQGRHGKGAALHAIKHFGAKYGQALGLQGQSYAIITKDLTKNNHPSISTDNILRQIVKLYKFAHSSPNIKFYIAYTTQPNLNGYTPQEMADMFNRTKIPMNIVFDKGFIKLLKT